MDVKQAAEMARSQLREITGLNPVTVTKTFKDEQGWHVAIDVLEMSRIPPATDVLGDYDLLLDDNGNLISFDRKRMRLRGEAGERIKAP